MQKAHSIYRIFIMQCSLFIEELYILVLYTEKYFRPFRLRCQRANLRLGEFYCLKLSFLDTIEYGQIQDRAKLCKLRRAKITRGQK